MSRADKNTNTEHNADDTSAADNQSDVKLNRGELGGANNNANMEYNASELDKANNYMNTDLNTSELGRANKNANREHNMDGVNNTPDANRAKNVKKKKMYMNLIYFDYC